MHELQPVHDDKSIAMPQRWPLYSCSWNSERWRGFSCESDFGAPAAESNSSSQNSQPSSAAQFGSAQGFAAVTSLISGCSPPTARRVTSLSKPPSYFMTVDWPGL